MSIPLTISLKEEVLMELDYEVEVPCVVRWGFLWCTAPSQFDCKLDCHGARIVKYHEFTNLAIESAINVP